MVSSKLAAKSFAVKCFTCGGSFDAVTAPWCACLACDRTFVCSHCENCFCTSPAIYRRMFWDKAPQALWDRRAQARRTGYTVVPNPPPESIPRPLILVVEDDTVVRNLAVHAITQLGYQTIHALDGEVGLDLARQYRPDLVLTDALMPKLDGREMCRILKTDPATRDLCVILMTSIFTNIRHALEARTTYKADGFLSKPISIRDLKATLMKQLTRRLSPA